MSEGKVFMIFQDTADARPFIEALTQENPAATVIHQPGLVRFEALGDLGMTREVVEEFAGRAVDLQELHLTLISLSGNIDEDDDYFRVTRH